MSIKMKFFFEDIFTDKAQTKAIGFLAMCYKFEFTLKNIAAGAGVTEKQAKKAVFALMDKGAVGIGKGDNTYRLTGNKIGSTLRTLYDALQMRYIHKEFGKRCNLRKK